MGSSMALGDSAWSGMFGHKAQGVELYKLGEGGLG